MANEKRALIVEDNKLAQNSIEFILTELGWLPPALAARGKDALEILTKERDKLDLIILDQNLPDFPGLDFLRRATNHFATLPPVIMLTGTDDPSLETKAKSLGAIAFIMKHQLSFDKMKELFSEIFDSNQST